MPASSENTMSRSLVLGRTIRILREHDTSTYAAQETYAQQPYAPHVLYLARQLCSQSTRVSGHAAALLALTERPHTLLVLLRESNNTSLILIRVKIWDALVTSLIKGHSATLPMSCHGQPLPCCLVHMRSAYTDLEATILIVLESITCILSTM